MGEAARFLSQEGLTGGGLIGEGIVVDVVKSVMGGCVGCLAGKDFFPLPGFVGVCF